jgi:hypothetical protein
MAGRRTVAACHHATPGSRRFGAYDRHLVFDYSIAMDNANPRQRFEEIARSLRDLLTQRWLLTDRTYQAGRGQAHLLPVDGVSARPDAGEHLVTPSLSRSRRARLVAARRSLTGIERHTVKDAPCPTGLL